MYVDKRLAGIAAVQTPSRLNRAHPGKDTAYVVDFVNDPEDILDAFKVYYDTAELADVTDPHIVYDLRAKLDVAGFYHDMGAFQRMYAFLSQIFDCGNTAIEKRSIFHRRLLPLLELGREREGIDLSKVMLTHHTLKNQGKRSIALDGGEYPKLQPLTEAGAGNVQEKQRAYLAEIVAKVNDLFEGSHSHFDVGCSV